MAQQLKELYSKIYISLLCDTITQVYAAFDGAAFKERLFDEFWQERALKARMQHIATLLNDFLTPEYAQNITILKAAFTKLNYAYSLENMLFSEYVGLFGLSHFEISMDALTAFTINSSSEFAVREFLIAHESQTLASMKEWAKSSNEHIRRLASEGSRPRLPWGKALESFKRDPTPILDILELLKNDESAYVRKSVANSLNDISKDHPHITKKITNSWLGNSKESLQMLKHACRTLLKRGDQEALKLFNLEEATHIEIKNFYHTDEVDSDGFLEFGFKLQSDIHLGFVRLEYGISFLRQNGSHYTKVFKIAEANYKTEERSFSKRYSFRPITTRNYYPGEHKLLLILNGKVVFETLFTLL